MEENRMKYRAKPCTIEAVQWTGDNLKEILDFCEGQAKWFNECENSNDGCIVIYTLEGNMEASVGDYIIKGIRGEFYPCKPDVFVKKYESIEEEKRMVVYISHKYGGDPENIEKIHKIVKRLSHEHPESVFFSPVDAFGFMYNDTTYEQGLNYCIEMLKRCDTMLVYGDWQSSRGCKAEIEYAKEHKIPYEIVEGE